MAQKINSQQLPRIPLVTIMNAQECPCLRRGCRCNYDNKHPFHEALLSPPANISVVDALKETIERLENHVESSNRREKRLKDQIHRVRQTSTGRNGQLVTEVKVGNSTIAAVIDSGADINYVNEEWCKEKNIPYKRTGWGWIKSYKGERTRTEIIEANIKIRVQGRFSRTKFAVLKKTGDDKLVLGIPWLEKANPVIDWKERTIKFHGKRDGSHWSPQVRIVDTVGNVDRGTSRKEPNERKGMVRTLPVIEEEENPGKGSTSQKKKEEHHSETPRCSAAYEKELREIQGQLPREIRDFADVFCTED